MAKVGRAKQAEWWNCSKTSSTRERVTKVRDITPCCPGNWTLEWEKLHANIVNEQSPSCLLSTTPGKGPQSVWEGFLPETKIVSWD
jgi:hypothetical protein